MGEAGPDGDSEKSKEQMDSDLSLLSSQAAGGFRLKPSPQHRRRGVQADEKSRQLASNILNEERVGNCRAQLELPCFFPLPGGKQQKKTKALA